MHTTLQKPMTKTSLGVVPRALAAVVAAAVGCDRWMSDGTTYRVGQGITIWHPRPERGGFLPWAFSATTPASGASYVALERVGSGAGAEVLAEAPLPAGAREVPVRLDFEQRRRAVLRVAQGTRFDVAAPLPLCCRGAGGLVASPAVLPQDSAGAIVLQYVVSERLARSDSASFEVARRLEGASYLRLRFRVRP